MMPGVGFEEMLVLALVAIIVIGPKDLPLMMRKFGRFTGKMRALAFDFKQGLDELGRQAELEELRKEVASLKKHTGLEDLQNDLRADQAAIEQDLNASMADPAIPTPTPVTHPAINGNGNGAAHGEAGEIAPYPGLSAEHPGYDTGEDVHHNGHQPDAIAAPKLAVDAGPAPLPPPTLAPVKQDTPA